MKINLSIPDPLAEKYINQFGLPGAYNQMRRALEAFQDVQKSDRWLFVAGDERRRVEAIFQTTMDDAKKLATSVENLSKFRIGGIDIQFTTDELARIDMQAQFHGRTRDQFVREMAEAIKARMLEEV